MIDETFMRRALQLAHKGCYTVSPNPRVGCVIVKSSPSDPHPHIIAEGYHMRKGEEHAERVALHQCQENPAGATMYVTLEPCCHHGMTPPCTEAILEAGIQRVVIASPDPFSQVGGRGISFLREKGLTVDVGVLEAEARYENRFFFHRHETGLPWVVLKSAVSLDGKCATATGHSQWITSETARAHVHQTRAEMDAILCGIGTVLADDPILTARPDNLTAEQFNPPTRIILDPLLKIPLNARILQTIQESPVWIVCSPKSDKHRQKELTKRGVKLLEVTEPELKFDLLDVLRKLAQENILSVFIEGGPQVHTAFLESHLVNELMIYIAPKLIGGSHSPSFYQGSGCKTMDEALTLQRIEHKILDNDILIQGILCERISQKITD